MKQMPYWIGATQVRVVNAGTPADSDIAWNAAPRWILVGGTSSTGASPSRAWPSPTCRASSALGKSTPCSNALASSATRGPTASCAAPGWLGGTADAFEHYVEHEQLLRKELQEVVEKGISLKQWTRMMLLDPKYKPTRKAVIDLPYMHGRIPGDRWISVNRLGKFASAGADEPARCKSSSSRTTSPGGRWTTVTRAPTATKHQVLTVPVEDLLQEPAGRLEGPPGRPSTGQPGVAASPRASGRGAGPGGRRLPDGRREGAPAVRWPETAPRSRSSRAAAPTAPTRETRSSSPRGACPCSCTSSSRWAQERSRLVKWCRA